MSDEIKIKANSGKTKLVIAIVTVIVVALTVGAILLLPKGGTAKKVAKQLSLGEKYLSELDYEQAIAAYELAIKIDPKCTDAYLGLADIYNELGEYDKAEAILEKARDNVAEEDTGRIDRKQERVRKNREEAEGTPEPTKEPEPTVVPSPTPEPIKTPTPEPTVAPVEGAIEWHDEAVEAAIRELLGIHDRAVTEADVAEITELNLNGRGIKDISDLERFPKLIILYLSNNEITDISVLSLLSELKKLYLDGNVITDITPVTGLQKLEVIVLTGNGSTDYSVLFVIKGLKTITVDGVNLALTPTPKPTATPKPTPKPTATPKPTSTPKPTAPPVPTQSASLDSVKAISKASVGDYVTFGTYEQDNDLGNGAEAIEWLVLEKKDGKALLLSKYALDAKPYNEKYTDVTWETCTLRSWLNSEFYRTAFSEKERGSIAETLVRNDDNPEYGTEGGNDTRDKVFLLSIEEVTTYFDSDPSACDPARRVKVTEYAKEQGGWYDPDDEYYGNGWWWLRSPGYYSNNAADVNYSGYVERRGYRVVHDYLVVRPALWIAY